jgi:type 1 glutamine amidotransferase
MRLMRWLLIALSLALASCSTVRERTKSDVEVGAVDAGGHPADAAVADPAAQPFRVLLFSRTVGFRHDSIPTAIAALTELQSEGGYVVEATEDPAQISAENLARFQVVVFLLTTGDVLSDVQQAEFEAWIARGGGYVGVHSASDTEYDWPFYGQLVGAYFKAHPAVQAARVNLELADHPAIAGLAAAVGLTSPWLHTDEWYDFRANPRGVVTVLATVDETSYTGGTMGADHPVIWAHDTSGGGRALYTALGHTKESYAEPGFRHHLVGALRWAARAP